MSQRTAALCAALLAGCSGADVAPPGEALTARRLAVVGGEASPAGGSDDAVVLLRVDANDRDGMCSAVLVAPNLLMTARHCVSYHSEGPFRCTVTGQLLPNDSGAGSLGLHLPPASLEVYGAATPREQPLARGARTFSTLSSTACANDVALVLLDTAVDLPIAPIRLGRQTRRDEGVVFVGFGTSEIPQEGTAVDWRNQLRRRVGSLTIAGVGPDALGQGVTTVAPRSLLVVGPSACLGDSGGPLFSAESGALVGIYSLLDGARCDDAKTRGVFAHVPPFAALIDEAFAAAGATPRPEPSPLSPAPDAAPVPVEASEEAQPRGAAEGCRLGAPRRDARTRWELVAGCWAAVTRLVVGARRRRLAHWQAGGALS